jgi:hypothetical protein
VEKQVLCRSGQLVIRAGGITMWEEEKVINQNKKLPGPLPGRPIKKQQDIILDKHRPAILLPEKRGYSCSPTDVSADQYYVNLA